MRLFLVFFVLFPSMAFATILPPNNLHLEDNLYGFTGIDQEQFNDAISKAEEVYKPIVESHGATLKINRLWTNATVNASAYQNGRSWMVDMFGGLARRQEISPDGFMMVIGHEIGHHIAGVAFYGNAEWASAEGAADYFATHSFAKMIWQNDLIGNQQAAQFVEQIPKEKCDAQWVEEKARFLCYRTAMAGKSLATLLGALGGQVPDFARPSTSVVTRTYTPHPHSQCRLDTYMSGALCKKSFDPLVIPGRGNRQLSPEAEQEAFRFSCKQSEVGFRPKCWYKQLESN